MQLKKILFVYLLMFYVIFSCKKSQNPIVNTPVVPKSNVDIYIGGYSFTSKNIAVATYWKNGVEYHVQDSSKASQVSGIGLIGDDVYLAGTEFSSLSMATYWKNGVPFNLAGNNSTTTSMCINGQDVYILGSIDSGSYISLVYWKNQVKMIIANSSTQLAGYSMSINNNDVYVAGFSEKSNSSPIATYWKNGVLTTLTDSSIYSTANAIAINSTNIYVAGTIGTTYNTTATSWKNGIQTSLSSAASDTYVNGITLNGSDVYVAGSLPTNTSSPTVTDQAVYWKNGIVTKLSYGTLSGAFAVAVNGNDIYVVGNGIAPNGNQVPVYWKNGIPVQLSDRGAATSINIVAH